MRRYLRAGAALCIGLSSLWCRKSGQPKEDEAGELLREIEPPELGARGATDCRPAKGKALTLLPAPGERIEVGEGVSVPGGFALSTLEYGTNSKARLFVRSGEETRDVVVGRVYGGDEPPQIAASAGTVFLSWIDADAGGRTIRLAAVNTSGSSLSVRKVLEVNTPLRPLENIELQAREDRVALVWDTSSGSAHGPSGIYCALYDTANLTAVGLPVRVSPRIEDASRPVLIPRPNGYWLLWIATLERGKDQSEHEPGLVDAPPERLRILELGQDCSPLGRPLDVGPPGPNIEFDAAPGVDSLFVVSKDDRSTYALRLVQPSGTLVERGGLDPPDLELPRLIATRDAPWILGRARDGATLVGRIQREGAVLARPEPSLLGAEVLGVVDEDWIIERSRGPEREESVFVEVISCGTGAQGPK